MRIHIRRLTPAHVGQLVDLEQKNFPIALRLGADRFHYFLSSAEIKGTNFSIGVFDHAQLVGYALMVNHPSDFFPGEEVAYVISLAVIWRYRRTAVAPLVAAIFREAFVTGSSIEGKLRELTAFRTIQRNWRIVREAGYRATRLVEIDPIGDDRIINMRLDHIFQRDRFTWGAYQALTQPVRTGRMLRAVPRRALRKICSSLPRYPWPARLRQLSYLAEPQIDQSEKPPEKREPEGAQRVRGPSCLHPFQAVSEGGAPAPTGPARPPQSP